MGQRPVTVTYFSDILCVWAYVAQIRLDELQHEFGDRVTVEHRFVPVFGNTSRKIGEGWRKRGGFEGYASHVRGVAVKFDHVVLHPAVWTDCKPAGSLSAHQFLEAAALATGRDRAAALGWRLRLAFFRDCRDVSRLDVQLELARELELPADDIRARLEDGSAAAALAEDHEIAVTHGVTGSPTFLINEGRQILYGNVGYRIIQANVEELLRDNSDKASWC